MCQGLQITWTAIHACNRSLFFLCVCVSAAVRKDERLWRGHRWTHTQGDKEAGQWKYTTTPTHKDSCPVQVLVQFSKCVFIKSSNSTAVFAIKRLLCLVARIYFFFPNSSILFCPLNCFYFFTALIQPGNILKTRFLFPVSDRKNFWFLNHQISVSVLKIQCMSGTTWYYLVIDFLSPRASQRQIIDINFVPLCLYITPVQCISESYIEFD